MEIATRSQEKAYKIATKSKKELIFFIRSSEFEKCPYYYSDELFKPHRVIVVPDAHIEDTEADFYIADEDNFNQFAIVNPMSLKPAREDLKWDIKM